MTTMWEESFADAFQRLTKHDFETWVKMDHDAYRQQPAKDRHEQNLARYSAAWIADFQYVIATIQEQTGLSRLEAMLLYTMLETRGLVNALSKPTTTEKEPWQNNDP